MRSARVLYLGALIVALAALMSVVAASPPRARGDGTPPTEFAASRAMVHLAAIAGAPHPVGSPAHAAVRAYLLEVLAGLGLETRVEEGSSVVQAAGFGSGARVKNVLARLPGTRGSGPAVLLAAHYDSVPQSRGASDDGAGTVTLLETARALAAGPRLQNDVIFFFSDGEELVTSGAAAFVRDELPKQPIGVVLNFEARGTRGAVAMYDTSTGNGALIRSLFHVRRPITSSLLGSLSRTLPNDSDATVFEHAGLPTMAFAYVDHLFEYHQYTDSLDALDARSLQHHGDYAVPLARYFGDQPLPVPRASDAVYFDLLGRVLVAYSTLVARILAVLTLGLFLYVLQRALRFRVVTLGAVAGGVARASGSIFAALVAAGVLHAAAAKLTDSFLLFARPGLMTCACAIVGAAAAIAVQIPALRDGRAPASAFGAMVPWAFFLALTAIVAPGASFAFQWPLAFALVGVARWVPRRQLVDFRTDLAVTLSLVPMAIFWTSLAYTFFVMFASVSPEPVTLVVAFALLLLVPALARTRPGEVKWGVAGLTLAGIGIAAASVLILHRVHGLPRADSLRYTVSPWEHAARWSARGPRGDAFVAQRVPAGRGDAPAPLFDFAAPAIESHSADEGDFRRITVDVAVPPGTRCLEASAEGGERVVRALVDGLPPTNVVRFSPELDEKLFKLVTGDTSPPHWSLEYCGVEDSVKLELFARATGKPVHLEITEAYDGLPGPPLSPRPRDLYPAHDSDATYVTMTLTL